MIRSAAQLLSRAGLAEASFRNVLEASGAPRGSIYHHFPGGKDELVQAAVLGVGERVVGALRAHPPRRRPRTSCSPSPGSSVG